MDNFEEFLKQEADSFKMQPSDKVWKGVREGIAKPKRVFVWWYAVAAILIVSGISLAYFIKSGNKDSISKTNENTIAPEINNSANKSPQQNTNPSNNKNTNASNSSTENNLVIEGKSNNKINQITGNPSLVKKQELIFEQQIPEVKAEAYSVNMKSHDDINNLVKQEGKQITFVSASIAKNTMLDANRKFIINAEVEALKRITFSVLAGTTIAKPLQGEFKDFIKPSFGYNFQLMAAYHLNRRVEFSVGLGYQRIAYKVGVVSTYPETIYVSTSNGTFEETAKYRLNNESNYKNSTSQILIPINVGYGFPNIIRHGRLAIFAGYEFSTILGANYIIKNKVNDKLFSDNEFLNSFNNYISAGATLTKRINKKLSWVLNYKLQYQNVNTFKPGFDYKEHLLVNGLNIGLEF